jgi:hypothetical protein
MKERNRFSKEISLCSSRCSGHLHTVIPLSLTQPPFFLFLLFFSFFASEKLVIVIGVSARSSASRKSAFPSIWLGASSESPWHSDWSSKQTWEDSCMEGISGTRGIDSSNRELPTTAKASGAVPYNVFW